MTKFKIGDKVKIVDSGEAFPCYKEFMFKYGSKEDCLNWELGKDADKNFVGTIKAIGKHERPYYNDLAIVSDENNAYIVEVNGLEKVEDFMTIQEFYNWAVERGLENLPFGIGIKKNCDDIDEDEELLSAFNLNNVDTEGKYYNNNKCVKDKFMWVYLEDNNF